MATTTAPWHYYAAGYYYVAKRQRLEHARHPEPALAAAPSKEWPERQDADASAEQVPMAVSAAVQTGDTRVDTPPHRPTLALFRGELR